MGSLRVDSLQSSIDDGQLERSRSKMRFCFLISKLSCVRNYAALRDRDDCLSPTQPLKTGPSTCPTLQPVAKKGSEAAANFTKPHIPHGGTSQNPELSHLDMMIMIHSRMLAPTGATCYHGTHRANNTHMCKPIKCTHASEHSRSAVYQFMLSQTQAQPIKRST